MNKQAFNTEDITRYLLGETAPAEREAFEEAFFDDDALHTQVEERENELIDDYVRGRLAAPLRERFERRRAANPALRQRVAVAQTLLPALETLRPPQPVRLGWWNALLAAWRAQRLAFQFALAAASLLCVAGTVWLFNENRRLRDTLAQLQTAQSAPTQRERELAQQVAAAREQNQQLLAELARLQQPNPPDPAASSSPAPSLFATLTLTADGVLGNAPTQTPQVTLTAQQPRLRLLLRTLPGRQPRYRAELLRAADARPVWRAENLKPTNRRHSTFTLTIPADQLTAGEYIIKVEGLTADNDTFTLLNTNFIVAKP